jgi:hypothetical protein
MKKRNARAESIMRDAAQTLRKMKKSKNIGGKAKVYTGPKNGKYIIKNGTKVYIKCK